ncbi:MAG: methyltransferase family protein [Candidatus Acidiferrales bacterium]
MFWLRIIFGLLVFFTLFIAALFGAAGRWDLPMFWAYSGVLLSVMLVSLIGADRDLMKERQKPGPGGKDHALRWLAIVVMLAHFIIAGLDVGRGHWSDTVPRWMQVVALAVIAAALGLSKWASMTNRFFSAVVRIQRDRGHHLVDTGPYAHIRHPGYAAAIGWFLLSGVALGSWLAAAIGAIFGAPLFLRRLFIEERMLLAELEGYTEYAQRVPYRLIPGIW